MSSTSCKDFRGFNPWARHSVPSSSMELGLDNNLANWRNFLLYPVKLSLRILKEASELKASPKLSIPRSEISLQPSKLRSRVSRQVLFFNALLRLCIPLSPRVSHLVKFRHRTCKEANLLNPWQSFTPPSSATIGNLSQSVLVYQNLYYPEKFRSTFLKNFNCFKVEPRSPRATSVTPSLLSKNKYPK